MTSDSEYLAARRRDDARLFLIGTLDHLKAPRIAPAFQAGYDLMAEHPQTGVPHERLLVVMAKASDLALKTIDNRLRQLVAGGFIEMAGRYERTKVRGQWVNHDSRAYRIGDWPLPDSE